MIYYKPVKIMINIPGLAKVIIDLVLHYHNIAKLIIINQGLLFTLKFWFLLCYFLGIKRRLSKTFYF